MQIEAKGSDVSYKSHSTQINLEDCSSEKDFGFFLTQRMIKEEDIYRKYPQIDAIDTFGLGGLKQDDPREECGLERTAHVTVLYGVKKENDYFKMRDDLKEFGSFPFQIGEISRFEQEDNDVIIIKINSEKLHTLHNLLKEKYENTYKFLEYRPHMTLAYVKKGTCKELEGKCQWTGTIYTCANIKFSHTEGYYLDIPLI